MAFTCGFYNGPNRMYNAEQLSSIFDGIISDGMYSNYRNSMIVIESENDNEVIVQPGRAWLMHTWSLVDANLPVEAPQSEVVLDRIDALVIDVNTNQEVKNNEITWVQGTPASQDPQRPALLNEEFHKQYPLCYVYRAAGTTSIAQENITNAVGTSELPFVTGIIDTINTDQLLLQWEAKWEEFMANYVSDFSAWSTAQKAAFETWFESIRGILDEDAAGHLQNEIDALRNDVDTLQNEVDGVEELIMPIGGSEEAPADTWTAMQVKNGDNVARLQMNAEGALRLFQSTDNGETWSQKEVGEKPTVRYNSETKYYEVLSNGLWYQDRYFDPQWDGTCYSYGSYDINYFDEFSGQNYSFRTSDILISYQFTDPDDAGHNTLKIGKVGSEIKPNKSLHILYDIKGYGGTSSSYQYAGTRTHTIRFSVMATGKTTKSVNGVSFAVQNPAYTAFGLRTQRNNIQTDIALADFVGSDISLLTTILIDPNGSGWAQRTEVYIKKIWIS